MTKHSLVTGGAGFIGSHLVDALLDEGARVRVLDNFSTGKAGNLESAASRIDVIDADLRDEAALTRALEDIEVVYHLAAFVSVPQSLEEPGTCLDINVNGTGLLLDLARQKGVRKVVLASSAAVYGDCENLPLAEDEPARPISPYAVSKRVGELYTEIYSAELGLEVVALRYFNVYGPRQNPASDYAAVIPIFLESVLSGRRPQIFGDGTQSRDFVFVGDVARANILAAKSPDAAGRVINICSGAAVNLLQLLDQMKGISGKDLVPEFGDPRPGDILRSLGDPALAFKLLGFQAQISLENGLQSTAEWMKSSFPG